MLSRIAVVLFILWLLGIVSHYMMSGFIHLLLVIAIMIVLMEVIDRKNKAENLILPPQSRIDGNTLSWKKIVSLLSLFAGMILFLEGIHAIDMIDSHTTRILTSSHIDSSLWMLVGGIIGASLGMVGLLNSTGKKQKR